MATMIEPNAISQVHKRVVLLEYKDMVLYMSHWGTSSLHFKSLKWIKVQSSNGHENLCFHT